ncbi:UDP-N-acetylglucosamine 2-epimerase [Actinosynnema sp. NPDC059335]|uniref:UDP-N-acetylglucosamine 2-epimerase n=1 Tax=Actinosynnema sp. NPDC059335 TaxID=3346804 RepID=UPI003672876E
MTATLRRPTVHTAPTPAPALRPGGVAAVLGARPEVFKLAPVLGALGDAARVVRPARDESAAVAGDVRGCRIAVALEGMRRAFAADRPDAVLVPGASDTAVAAALAAGAQGIPVVRVDAGLRGHEPHRAEEQNRVVLDRAADVLCAATPGDVGNLEAEGLGDRDVRVTGTTAVEAVRHRLGSEPGRLAVLRDRGLRPDDYVLATLGHVDDEEALFSLANQLAGVVDAGHPVVLPADPRTKAALARAGALSCGMGLRVVDRLWHSEFLALARHAALLVTDSDAVLEEATVLKRPVLAVGRQTARPEALRDFGVPVGPGDDLTDLALDWLADGDDRRAALAALPSPFGDGRGGRRIAAAVRDVVRTGARR